MKDKKIIELCIEAAKQNIDIEEVLKPIIELAIKNYKFIKGFDNNE